MNLAFFISGRGSNMAACIQACRTGRLKSKPVVVISNRANAPGLALAKELQVPAYYVDHRNTVTLPDDIQTILTAHNSDFIVLAGYLKKLPDTIVRAYHGRIINIHPALLPKHGGPGMYGIHVHQAVIDAHETTAGATTHYVTEEYDRGTIIKQATINVLPTDTPETLAARLLPHEHELLVSTIEGIEGEREFIVGSL